MNENIKHLRQIIENSIPATTTSGRPSPTLAEAMAVLDLLEADMRNTDRQLEQTIGERDAAEEALSQAYFLITGRSPEWSNLFGNKEAIEEIDACQRLLREREKPEIRGLLHTVTKWINAGHLVPNDDTAMLLHPDPKRATAAKMGMRLAQGAWLAAANKAVEPHENTGAPLLDTTLSNLSAALTWIKGHEERKIILSHGGDGGKYYANMKDEDGQYASDGVGKEPQDAIAEAMAGMEGA